MARQRTSRTSSRKSLTSVEPPVAPPAPVVKLERKPKKPPAAAPIRLLSKNEPPLDEPSKESQREAARVARARARRLARRKREFLPTVDESWLSELSAAFVNEQVEEKIRQSPTDLNEYGFDSWGLSPRSARYGYTAFAWLYRNYWRVQTYGIENVPSGRVLLIGNHSGQLPIDGVMVSVAMLLEAKPPRLCRAMVERWFTTLPVVGNFIQRHGAIVGDPLNCERLLERGEAIIVFPEGARGSGKVWRDRYKLMRFGLGFMRLAMATNTPIVPFGVIGGEEQAPSFVDAKPLAKLLGFPYFPLTPTFPWLGLLGMVPYPTKYRIHFGKPLAFRGNPDDRDEVIQRKVDTVKRAIRTLIDKGLEEREGVFF
jgi:1-acyl-sn-glycerol-3-phosphate acyltransferase